jgi:hypothetical protein
MKYIIFYFVSLIRTKVNYTGKSFSIVYLIDRSYA